MPTSSSTVIGRALVAGLFAAVVVGAWQLAVVEPVIDRAIALEEQLAADHQDHGHDHDDERFTRGEQVGGGVAGTAVYALVLAGIFGTVFAAVRHRLPGATDLARSTWLAAVGFATVALLPALEHPPNPPAVGDPDTVGQRTAQWAALVLIGIVLARLLVALSASLRRRGVPDRTRVPAVAAASVVAFVATLALFPGTGVDIDPAVPADLVWDFRIRSLGALALLWTCLGLGLGWLLDRDAARAEAASGAEHVSA